MLYYTEDFKASVYEATLSQKCSDMARQRQVWLVALVGVLVKLCDPCATSECFRDDVASYRRIVCFYYYDCVYVTYVDVSYASTTTTVCM